MAATAAEMNSASTTVQWLRGLWAYYRDYTHTAIHAVATAALTALGLLVFIDRLFVVLAIASYICPPIVLYSIGADVGTGSPPSKAATVRADSGTNSASNSDGDSDSDSDDDSGDSGSDGGDGDTDSDGADADGSDADADG